MDPNACFSELLDAVASGAAQEAHEHAGNLHSWLDHGGFAPGGGKLRLIAMRSFCEWVKTSYRLEE